MSKSWRNIHSNFKLNGASHSNKSLWDVAYSLVKEGKSFEIEIGEFLLDWLNNSDDVPVSTSGSTGPPKNINLRKESLINSANATGHYFGLSPADTALLCLPAKYIAGKMMLVRAMVLGLELDFVVPNSNPLESSTKMYDFIAMVPLQVSNSINELDRVKKLIIGGAPIALELKAQLQQCETQVYETYGMTETATHVAVRPIGETYYHALPSISISKDKRGCLVIHAPEIVSREVVTNDLVDIIDEDHFTWMGRFDNVINSGGVKLIPEQIELKLRPLMPNDFFAAGVPDKSLGEKLILVVEGAINQNKLMKNIKKMDSLQRFEIPKEIIVLKEFQRTKNGKINRLKTMKKLKL